MSALTISTQEKLEKINQVSQNPKTAKLLRYAIKYGVIKPGWSCIDYMRYAAKHHGWESTCISGPKGTLKSNLLLQHGMALYKDMNKVKAHFVKDREKLLYLMAEAIEKEVSIPWVGVDDIAVLFPKSLYFSHRKMYSELQSAWEASRTVINNFECTCVIKRKVAGFILEDITGDIKCYNAIFEDLPGGRSRCLKSHYDYRRWLWLRNLKDPTQDLAKLVSVEDIPFPATPESLYLDMQLKEAEVISGGKKYKGADFYRSVACLEGICEKDFNEYWNDRLDIAKTGFKRFIAILRESDKKLKDREAKEAPSPEELSKIRSQAARNRWDKEKPAAGP